MGVIVLTALWLLVISIMDIRKRNVPVWLLVSGGIMTVVISVYQQNVFWNIVKGMLPGITLLLIALITKKAGYGDGVVLLLLGVLSGGRESLLIFVASLFFMAVFSLILLVLRKVKQNTRMPYLPFLMAGWLVVAVF